VNQLWKERIQNKNKEKLKNKNNNGYKSIFKINPSKWEDKEKDT
jgi:hypothetical protein